MPQTKQIEIINQDTGELADAEQLVCGCGCDAFIVYRIEEDHMHLQCANCTDVICSKYRTKNNHDNQEQSWSE